MPSDAGDFEEGALERLRHAQRMIAAGRLAGTVAHDLNNLLQVIAYHAGELAKDQPRSPHAEAISLIIGRATSLTHRVLALSRPQKDADRERLCLGELAEDALHLLKPLFREPIIIEPRIDREVFIDAERAAVFQVLLNLLLNAKDAMPAGGTLSVAVHRDSEEPDRWVRLVVADEGIGMTPEIKARIFEPYFTTKGPERGYGIGLSTVAHVVDDHAGRISVTSAEGRGATFEVILPAAV